MKPWIIVLVYFIIGGAATAIINNKKPVGAPERWIKYVWYILIVFSVMGLIWFGLFFWTALLIFFVGLYEVINVGKGTVLLVGLIVYMLIGILFILSTSIPSPGPLLTYVVVLTFDGFSQITGQLFGKTKLAPNISLGKTVEGLTGGFIVAVATAYYIGNGFLPAAGICVAALAGDLLASYYKRKCNVKDFSRLVPGHGGVLDRFDSLIFAGACLWIMT